MNELHFQKHLVDAANELGGHAYKCSHQFTVGVVDLSVKLRAFPHVFMECKRHSWLNGAKEAGLTPHQRKFMREYREAGGITGWCTYAPTKGKRDWYDIYASADIGSITSDVRVVFNFTNVYRRPRGEPWPIEWIIKQIVNQSGVHRSYSES